MYLLFFHRNVNVIRSRYADPKKTMITMVE